MAIPHGQIVSVSTGSINALAAGAASFAGFSFPAATVQPLGVQLAVASASAADVHGAKFSVRQVITAGSVYNYLLQKTSLRTLDEADLLSLWWMGSEFGLLNTAKRGSSSQPFEFLIETPATGTTLTLVATLFVFVP